MEVARRCTIRRYTLGIVCRRIDLEAPGCTIVRDQHAVGTVVVAELHSPGTGRNGEDIPAEAGAVQAISRRWILPCVEPRVDVLRQSIERKTPVRNEMRIVD